MKKILLLSLAVMFLCWSFAVAAPSLSGKPTPNGKVAPVIDKEAIQASQPAKVATPVTNNKISKVQKQPQAPIQKSIYPNAVGILPTQQSQPDQTIEKKSIRAAVPGLPVDTKYHGPATMPNWYTPNMATVNLLSEGFEGGGLPTNWTDEPGASPWVYNGGTSHGPGAAHTGNFATDFNIYDYSSGTEDALCTPYIDFSAYSGAYLLSFWYWHNSGSDYLRIILDDNGTQTVLMNPVPNTGVPWTQIVIPFATTSTHARIMFMGHSFWGLYNLYVDDVSIDEAPSVGRCCYGDPTAPSCADNSQIECDGLGGTWNPVATCAGEPCPAVMLGDVCAAPFQITALPYTDTRNTADFNNDYNAHGRDVVYEFTLADRALVDVSLCNTATPFDTWMGIWAEGSCGGPTFLYSNDDDACASSTLLSHIANVTLDPGTYFIMVESYFSTSDGVYTLDVTSTPVITPANDECVNAEAITGPYPVDVYGSNIGATADCPGLLDWNGVWYTIDLPYANNNVSLDWCLTTAGEIQYVGIVYMMDCSCTGYEFWTYTWPTCGSGLVEPLFTKTIAGPTTIYLPAWVSADPMGGESPMDFGFTVDVTEAPPPPENDNCEAVTPVQLDPGAPVQFTGDNTSATMQCTALGYPDVWHAIHTDVCMDITIDYCGTTPTWGDAFIVMTDACPCGTLIRATSWVQSCPDGNWTINFMSIQPGDYWLPVILNPAFNAGPGPYVMNVTGTECPPPPENDNCVDATPINEVVNLPFQTRSATFDGSGVCQTAPNIWFLYTATVTGNMNISLCGSGYDTKMAVYDGPDCPIAPPALQGGEDFASATPITDALPVHYTGTTAGYVDNTPLSCVYDAGAPDVFYSYVPPEDQTVNVTLCGSSFDTGIGIFDAAYAELACNDDYCSVQSGIENFTFLAGQTYYIEVRGYYNYSGNYAFNMFVPPEVTNLIECNDDACGLQSMVQISAEAGHQYLIEVGGFSSTTIGDGILSIVAPPPNDNCVDVTPEPLEVGAPLQFVGDNTGASGDCAAFGTYPNVWVAFTTSECANITLDYCGTTPAFGNAWLNMALDCDCIGITAAGAFDVTTCPDGNVTVRWSAMPAATYYYPVLNDPLNFAVGPYIINVSAEACPPPPENDACATPTAVNEVENLPFSTIFATPDNLGDCITSNDIWYLYTATISGSMNIGLCGSSYDTKLAVYDGPDCPAVAPVPIAYQGGEDFATAAPVIDPLPVIYTGTTTGYIQDYTPSCMTNGLAGPDVVYAIAPVSDVLLTASLCGTGFDTGIGIYDAAATEIACNDDFCGLQSEVIDVPLTAGATYYIVVTGYSGANGNYTLALTTPGETTLIECNDDNCGLQSLVTITAEAGHQYLVQVGGFGPGVAGDGLLTIAPPPPNPCDNAVYTNGEATGFAYGTQCAAGYPFTASVADDFILPGTGDVTIDTVIAYVAFWNGAGDPNLFSAVGVTIYADNGGSPGGEPLPNDPGCTHSDLMGGSGIIASEDIPAGAFSFDVVGANYRLILPITDVVLEAGTTYWLEIFPHMEFPPQVGWVNTDIITGNPSMQEFQLLGTYPWTSLNLDMAFCLVGPSVHPFGTIAGVVTDAVSHVPLNGVTITTFDPDFNVVGTNTSGDLGEWTLELPPGTYSERLSKSGYADTTIDVIIVSAGSTTNVATGIRLIVGPQCLYYPGDINDRGHFTGLDVVYGVSYLKGGPPPLRTCECTGWTGPGPYIAGDVNGSCSFTGLDITYMVAYLKGGPALRPCPTCPPQGDPYPGPLGAPQNTEHGAGQ